MHLRYSTPVPQSFSLIHPYISCRQSCCHIFYCPITDTITSSLFRTGFRRTLCQLGRCKAAVITEVEPQQPAGMSIHALSKHLPEVKCPLKEPLVSLATTSHHHTPDVTLGVTQKARYTNHALLPVKSPASLGQARWQSEQDMTRDARTGAIAQRGGLPARQLWTHTDNGKARLISKTSRDYPASMGAAAQVPGTLSSGHTHYSQHKH